MKNDAKIRAVYVIQFGAYWKLTPQQWRDICHDGMNNGGYCLPDEAALSRRPHTVHVDRDPCSGGTTYWTTDKSLLVYEPLDWDPEAFKDALKDLDELESLVRPS